MAEREEKDKQNQLVITEQGKEIASLNDKLQQKQAQNKVQTHLHSWNELEKASITRARVSPLHHARAPMSALMGGAAAVSHFFQGNTLAAETISTKHSPNFERVLDEVSELEARTTMAESKAKKLLEQSSNAQRHENTRKHEAQELERETICLRRENARLVKQRDAAKRDLKDKALELELAAEFALSSTLSSKTLLELNMGRMEHALVEQQKMTVAVARELESASVQLRDLARELESASVHVARIECELVEQRQVFIHPSICLYIYLSMHV